MGGSPRCAMKWDIQKAYDSVDWNFLWDVMASMNFPTKVLKWVQVCVTTAHYMINMMVCLKVILRA